MKINYLFLLFLFFCYCNNKPDDGIETRKVRINSVLIGEVPLVADQVTESTPTDEPIIISFSKEVDINLLKSSASLSEGTNDLNFGIDAISNTDFVFSPSENLRSNRQHELGISSDLVSIDGSTFSGATYRFRTEEGSLKLLSVQFGDLEAIGESRATDVPLSLDLRLTFSKEVNLESLNSSISIGGDYSFNVSQDGTVINVSTESDLPEFTRFVLSISDNLIGGNGELFTGYAQEFYTSVDPILDFPEISDDELLTKIQEQTFKYFYDFGHPTSGLARERDTSGDLVTIGGSGFGLMAMIVGIERGFISRQEGIDRLEKMINFLANDADRFHGVWSHWLSGSTGDVIPFSADDNGGDLVETSFLVQGLLTVRQYLDDSDSQEATLISTINTIWEEVEWSWHVQEGTSYLTWHWSPNFGFQKDLRIRGWNESLITYVLAASSPMYTITKEVYDEGWAGNGSMVNGGDFYGITLPLGSDRGGPLFFSHYSFLGLDPTNLSDQYASNYFTQNEAHSLINRAYCIDNPRNYVGYGESSWGLTASDNHQGYSAHSPNNDLGVITPTAAISSIPYTPDESMDAIRHFYYLLGDKLWGEYGFHDAFNVTEGWYADSYLAIDQGPIIIMIENHRTVLLWDLFMSAPEVQNGLDKLGFTY